MDHRGGRRKGRDASSPTIPSSSQVSPSRGEAGRPGSACPRRVPCRGGLQVSSLASLSLSFPV